MPGDPRFHALCKDMMTLHDKKQEDYGTDHDPFANVRASEEIGIPAWKGAYLRLRDKIKRLDTYCLKGKLANEGVEDSFMDLSVYSLIALILFRETKTFTDLNGKQFVMADKPFVPEVEDIAKDMDGKPFPAAKRKPVPKYSVTEYTRDDP